MNDFLGQVLASAFATAPVVRPRLPSFFEPVSVSAGRWFDAGSLDETVVHATAPVAAEPPAVLPLGATSFQPVLEPLVPHSLPGHPPAVEGERASVLAAKPPLVKPVESPADDLPDPAPTRARVQSPAEPRPPARDAIEPTPASAPVPPPRTTVAITHSQSGALEAPLPPAVAAEAQPRVRPPPQVERRRVEKTTEPRGARTVDLETVANARNEPVIPAEEAMKPKPASPVQPPRIPVVPAPVTTAPEAVNPKLTGSPTRPTPDTPMARRVTAKPPSAAVAASGAAGADALQAARLTPPVPPAGAGDGVESRLWKPRQPVNGEAPAPPVRPCRPVALEPTTRLRFVAPVPPVDHDPSTRPTVHITIGRLEIRAVTASAPQPRREAPAARVLSLDDYLRQRATGGAR